MKQHHFQRSKLAELMTFEEYTEFNNKWLADQHVPDHCKVQLNKQFAMSKGANLLTKLIVVHAKLQGHELKRTNNMGVPIIDKRTKKVTGWRGSSAGAGKVLDITGSIWGESVEIEVKYGKDKLSTWQSDHIRSVQSRGGIAIVVRTFTEYLDQLNWIYDKEKYKQWKISQLS